MTRLTKIDDSIDRYLVKPLLYDFILVVILLVGEYFIEKVWKHLSFPLINILDRPNEINLFSNLISSTVALAGFMVAALTIMITVKSSLTARGIEDSKNALDIIFSTKHYQSILRVFKDSIIELIILSILLYLGWLYSQNFSEINLFKFLLSAILVMALALVRSLYILFEILNLENCKKED